MKFIFSLLTLIFLGLNITQAQDLLVEGDATVTGELTLTGESFFNDPVKLKEPGSGPSGPELDFMNNNSATQVGVQLKYSNPTGGGNNGNFTIKNNMAAGFIAFSNFSTANALLIPSSGTVQTAKDFGVKVAPLYDLDILHGVGSPGGGSTNGIQIKQSGGTGDSWQIYISSTSGDLQFFNGGTLRGTFDEANGTYTSSSDRRLKENISDLENQLAVIQQLRPKKYHFKDKEHDGYSFGLIAQEVLEIIPEIVKDGDAETKYMSLSYSELIPVLIAGVQEQQVMINSLQDQVEQLRSEIASFAKIRKGVSDAGDE